MGQSKYFIPKNYHLIISVVVVIMAALMYGLAPGAAVPRVFDIDVETVDLANVFRVIMCLYLAISGVWFTGIIKPSLWRLATLSNILFMGSITTGRIISLIADGVPSITMICALAAELALVVYGVLQYIKYRDAA